MIKGVQACWFFGGCKRGVARIGTFEDGALFNWTFTGCADCIEYEGETIQRVCGFTAEELQAMVDAGDAGEWTTEAPDWPVYRNTMTDCSYGEPSRPEEVFVFHRDKPPSIMMTWR